MQSMETNAGLVAGSYIGNELVLIDLDTGSHIGNELVETNAGLVTGSHIQNVLVETNAGLVTGSHIQKELVETNAGLVAGSYMKNELMVIPEEDIKLTRPTALKQYSEPLDYWSAQMCRICGENVELSSTGDVFVACYECDFPVCQPCYEYERQEGHQSCPQCNTRYKRHKGCPTVEGDDESDDVSSDMKDGFVDGEPQWKQGENLDQFLDSGDESERPSPSFRYESQYPTLLTDGNVPEGLSNAIPDYESTLAITSGSLDYGESDCYSLSCVEPSQPVPERIVDCSEDLNSYAIVQDYLNDSMEGLEHEQNMTKLIISKGKGKMEYMDFDSYELQMDIVTDQLLNGVVPDSPDLTSSETEDKPLSCVVPIPPYLLILYRTLIVLRLLVLVFFFRYRITNPVPNAYPLWLVSVVCEIWFALSWLLDQFPKWSPINRETFIDRLALRYDQEGEPSQLAPIDIFVSTVDPQKEPPIVTANTVLSILSVDYPVEKVSCYVSDDGAAMLTFETLSVTAEFARMWVPFCKKHSVEPRAPEYFFAQKINYYEDRMLSSFVRDRRNMKRAYEEFKVKINALVAKTWEKPREGWRMMDGSPWPGNNPRDHPGMIQVFLGHNGALDTDGNALPRLVYVSREKRPGFQHYKKAGAMNALIRVSAVLTNGAYILNLDCDHYVNNSKALREAMCFFMDPVLRKKTCYVQFPQRFDGIDRSDRYANRNVVFFDVNLRGLDGIQGPVYVGTGCCFNRQALYGNDPVLTKADLEPNIIVKICRRLRKMNWFSNKTYNIKKLAKIRTESQSSIFNMEDIEEVVEGYDDGMSDIMPRKGIEKRFGHARVFIDATLMEDGGIPPKHNPALLLKEAIHVISCSYEGKTEWGKEVGWIYGSVTEDILTGLKMHARGWSSIYCIPERPAFKGSAPLNLSDRLHQVLRWALGSIEILLSKHCPIWYSYGGRLKLLQRIAYINTTVYPLTSFPLIAYCTLPAVCLLTGKFIIPQIGNVATIWFGVFFASVYLTGIMELKWSGISIEDWWRNEQFWVIGGTSAHLFAVFQGMLKVIAGIDTNFTVTSKASDEDGDFEELYSFKWTSLLIIPTTLLILNLVAIVGAVAYDIESGSLNWGPLLGKLFFSMWVIIHLYPFMKGLLGRQNRIPTIVIVWSVLIISIFSLIWVRTDPLSNSMATAAIVTQCGFDCETF